MSKVVDRFTEEEMEKCKIFVNLSRWLKEGHQKFWRMKRNFWG